MVRVKTKRWSRESKYKTKGVITGVGRFNSWTRLLVIKEEPKSQGLHCLYGF